MNSKKSTRREKRFPVKNILITSTVMAIVIGVLLYSQSSKDMKQPLVINSSSSKNGSSEVSSTNKSEFSKVIGRWLRPDGGYVIEITDIGEDGSLDASYFNPRSINVSQAEIVSKDGTLEIFIELRDVGYPGARYSLVYSPQDDTLQGLYYQPSVGQSFEVIFIRKLS